MMITLQLVAGSEDDFHMQNGAEWYRTGGLCPDNLQE